MLKRLGDNAELFEQSRKQALRDHRRANRREEVSHGVPKYIEKESEGFNLPQGGVLRHGLARCLGSTVFWVVGHLGHDHTSSSPCGILRAFSSAFPKLALARMKRMGHRARLR